MDNLEMTLDWKSGTWFLAGHRGLAGSALLRGLISRGVPESHILTRTRDELDLRNREAVENFFAESRPKYVLLAAAVVGGIEANRSYPVQFLKDNMDIQNNVIGAAADHGTERLLFLGSSCIYPRNCPQPMKPEYLLTGSLEPTNQWYAIAKIAGIKLCQAYFQQYSRSFISVMPTNLYGPGDNYHSRDSHVLPALIRRFHDAKMAEAPSVTCWGTGTPLREFLYSDDFAEACLFALENYNAPDILNIGSGSEIAIRDLAQKVATIVGYQGQILWDTTKPDGTPRKMMDSSVLAALGWNPAISLNQGIAQAYQDFLKGFNERTVA